MLGEKAPSPARATGGYQSQQVPVNRQPEAVKNEYLVYNGHLKSVSKGLKYRSSPDLKDYARGRKLAEFGEYVLGVPTSDGCWLKIGRLYLPMEVQGVPVLIPTAGTDHVEEEDPAEMWKKWKMPMALSEAPEFQGRGTIYEVVHEKVVGRPAPSFAAPVQTYRSRGAQIELFEFDETGKWRQGIDDRSFHMVWFLIDHEEFGPLLRPKAQPFSVKPMEPVCVAADEGLSFDLQRFLDGGAEANIYDASGRTPLMLAAAKDQLECCVLLVEGGADPSLRSVPPCMPPGRSAVDMTKSAQTKALLKAISGYRDFDIRNLDRAMESLGRDLQETVERLLEAAERKVAQGVFLIEGQELGQSRQTSIPDAFPEVKLSQPAPKEDSRPKEFHSDGTHTGESGRGVLHEVVYSAVWIRKEASVDSSKIAVKKQGEYIELFELDNTGDWARVEHEVYAGHYVTGWMLIKHENLGMLLKPVKQGRAFEELA